ncbi:MAG TPA: 6-hydroxymethylpterin diphosphokinase MptE-like protein [Chlamydiales bacterium]
MVTKIDNLALFSEKFPQYALLVPQWEPKKMETTSFQWDETCLNDIEVLYLFGLEDGSFYQKLSPWLHQHPERQLILLEEDEGVVAAHLLEEALWLLDAQVDFALLPKGKSKECLFQELAEKYPAKHIEVFGSPKERLNLLRKSTLSHALFTDRLHGFQPFDNFVRNVPRLQGGFYANGLKNAFQGVPVIVCGAGPSLEMAIPLLKQLEGRAIVIAGGSTLAALSAHGYQPHFGVAIDPNLEEYHRFQSSFCFECPLLFSTRVFPGIFHTCNGPFGYLRSGVGGALELWLEEELKLTDPLLGHHLSDESISVTSICLAFAQHIGASAILLSGVDLAYTGGRRYAGGVTEEKLSIKELEKGKNSPDRIVRKKDKQGRFVYTAVRWVMEAASISHYAKRHPEICWINATEGGLPIKGVKNMSLQAAAEKFLTKQTDLRGQVAQQIALHPMPSNPSLLQELRISLERLIAHLETLSGQKSGSKALAELEMRDELATSILFYDMPKVLEQTLSRKVREKGALRDAASWTLYHQVAKKYLERFESV